MPTGSANLFLNEIEIVEEPFASRGNAPAFLDGFGKQAVRRDQNPLVFGEAKKKLFGVARRTELVGAGQDLAILLHLLGVEKFRAKGRLDVETIRRRELCHP